MNAVFSTDFLHPLGNLRLAVCWEIRKHVMLDLIAQVSTQNVQPAATREVGRAGKLAQIPVALALTFAFPLCKGFCILSEVAAENNRLGPEVPDQVGPHVAGQHDRGHRQSQ